MAEQTLAAWIKAQRRRAEQLGFELHKRPASAPTCVKMWMVEPFTTDAARRFPNPIQRMSSPELETLLDRLEAGE